MRSQFITRSWILKPSYLHHRAGKHLRWHTTFAYRVFTEIPHQNIPRDHNPYQLRSSYPTTPTKPPSMVTRQRRLFHSARRDRSVTSNSKIPHISVHIAAASTAKGGKYRPEKSTVDYDRTKSTPALGLEDSSLTIFQKRRARPDSGQDSYFVAPVALDSNQHTTALGVCDGVGGWADHGIDPADFSHGLCSYMARTAIEWPQGSTKPDENLTPQQLLELGYNQLVKDPHIKAGGSTACVSTIDQDGRVRIANLGDSGFLLLRLGTVHSYSTPQTHAFNTPYQLSLTPPEIIAQAMIFGGLPLNDLPERADLSDFVLQHGDVLVFATDGLWDNLSSQDVMNSVSNIMRGVGAWERTQGRGYVATEKLSNLVSQESAVKEGLQATLQNTLAAHIVGEAKIASLNRKRDGPFAKAWKLHAPYDPYHGGKVDDITALVVIPTETRKSGGEEEDMILKAKL